MPGGNGVRIDSFVYVGYNIPSNYDSMIAKFIVKGANRIEAIAKMKRALEETVIDGVDTNIDYLLKILDNKDYLDGNIDISFITK